MAKQVRVRFAPSPTGGLHIGGLRTALYNYLFARHQGGSFVLRIEDTDQARKVAGAEAYIREALDWAGISPDESPWQGGSYGPYRQSERLDVYRQYAEQLVATGHAYYAFDTPEELQAMRELLQAAKAAQQQYGIATRKQMTNSLTLPEAETRQRLQSGEPFVIRLKVPADRTVVVEDIIRGRVEVASEQIDDKVLLKSDGYPTYHLANVVDDHLMQITHVIRGEEWLPSAPLHVLLYQLLGWEDTMPAFAHLPLLLKPEGSGKLSKRDADKHGFPIFPLAWTDPRTGEEAAGFREEGYLPEAVVNFLALLGWNPGTDEELFDHQRLIELFDLQRINKGGVKFDIEKARWFNQQYLKNTPAETLADWFAEQAARHGVTCPPDKAVAIAGALRERITLIPDLWQQGAFFLIAPDSYDEKTARKKWSPEVAAVLQDFADRLDEKLVQDGEATKQALWETAQTHGMGIGKVMPGLRLALTGSGGGPDLMTIIAILGAEETRQRIARAVERLG